MEPTPTLSTLISLTDDQTSDSEVVAQKIMENVLSFHQSTAREILFPTILNEVRKHRRGIVRLLERSVDKSIAKGTDPSAARKALVGATFWTPSTEFVYWLEATVEQHLERAKYQRTCAGGLIADARRHEVAAQEIQRAGVTCLNDLSPEALEVFLSESIADAQICQVRSDSDSF